MYEVKRIRESKGLSQAALANQSGVNPVTINRIEHGESSPTVTTLEKLAKALDVEMGDFFPKAQSPLPLEEDAGHISLLEPEIWQNYATAMADRYEDLASQDAPIEQIEGWAEVCWFHATYVVNVVKTLDDMVNDCGFTDEDNEMLPLLKATRRMAHQANRVIERVMEGPDRNVESRFWEIVGEMNLTEEQRGEITA